MSVHREEGAAMRTRWRQFPAWGVAVLTALMVVGCAEIMGRGSVDDVTITSSVKSRFVADPTVSASAINVDTSRGVVSLTGFVDTEQERQRAIQIAQGVAGVRQVNAVNLVVKR
jgi:hyperosmotically inducible protein